MTWTSMGVIIGGAHVLSFSRSKVYEISMRNQRFVSKASGMGIYIHGDNLVLTPGFIDLQINGFGGQEFISGDDPIALAQAELPSYGVTSFLPTTGSVPLEKYRPSALRGMIERAQKRPGAEVIGWHLEGPFINPYQAGIHPTSCILNHVDELFWKELFRTGAIALMTLAPEMPFAHRLLDILSEFKIPAAIGHSQATEADLLLAEQKGVRFVTHLFNAMLPFHHRCPGIIGAVLAEKRFGYTLISDLYHLFPEALQIAFRSHPENLALVTDGSPLMGSRKKRGRFLGNHVEIRGEKVVTIPDGGLAGSFIPFDEHVRRFYASTGCSFEDAIRAASEVPATLVNLIDRKGKVAVGFDADCVLWDQSSDRFSIVASFCKGEVAFARPDFWQRVEERD